MLQAIHNAYAGIYEWSNRFRDVVHNANNIDKPGFKGRITTDSTYYDLGRYYNPYHTKAFNQNTDWQAGKFISAPGNTSFQNLSIAGMGWFVFKQDDQIIYSRNGQLSIDKNGYFYSLDLPHARLQALGNDGKLYDFRENMKQSEKHIEATNKIQLNETFYYITKDDLRIDTQVIGDKSFNRKIVIHDSQGKEYQLLLTFTYNLNPNPPIQQSWRVIIKPQPEDSCKIFDKMNQPFIYKTIFDSLTPSASTLADMEQLKISTAEGETLNVSLDLSQTTLQHYTQDSTPGTEPLTSDLIDTLCSKTESSNFLIPDDSTPALNKNQNFYIDNQGRLIYPYGTVGHADIGDTIALAMVDTAQLQELSSSPGYYVNTDNSKRIYHTARELGTQIMNDKIESSNVSADHTISDLLRAEQMLQGNAAVIQVSDKLIKSLYQLDSNNHVSSTNNS